MLNDQNQYIHFLERKYKDERDIEHRNKANNENKQMHMKVNSSNKTVQKNIVNNNIIITNICSNFNDKNMNSFFKKKRANDYTIDENDSVGAFNESELQIGKKNILPGFPKVFQEGGASREKELERIEKSSGPNSKVQKEESDFSISEQNFGRNLNHF